jgi:type II secretory pathway component PulC
MMAMSRNIRALLGVLGLLSLWLIWQIVAPVSHSVPKLTGVSKTLQPGIEFSEAQSLGVRETFAEVEQRPLFVSSRRPSTAAATPVAAQLPSLDRYVVIGIVASPTSATALIRGPSGPVAHLHAGQTLEGWTLETIASNKVVFAASGQHQELEVKTSKGSQPPGR